MGTVLTKVGLNREDIIAKNKGMISEKRMRKYQHSLPMEETQVKTTLRNVTARQ